MLNTLVVFSLLLLNINNAIHPSHSGDEGINVEARRQHKLKRDNDSVFLGFGVYFLSSTIVPSATVHTITLSQFLESVFIS